MDIERIDKVYFIGIGGIGMSALARYFNIIGKNVAGYDLTCGILTEKLEQEGVEVIYDDNVDSVPAVFRETDKSSVLVVCTPAIPSNNNILRYFTKRGFTVLKRSQVLGGLFNDKKGIAVAGTHGKTSVSVLCAHILNSSDMKCSAFLGGISKNQNSNLIVSKVSDLMVTEADEFDRSFLQLHPHIGVVTSMDADHLDIYGDYSNMKSAFHQFTRQIKPGGVLIYKKGLDIPSVEGVSVHSYGLDSDAVYNAYNIRTGSDGRALFDMSTPVSKLKDLKMAVPGRFNVENAVAAVAVALTVGVNESDIRKGLDDFSGIYRRFEFHINRPGSVFIDDYAHHPAELTASLSAIREMFPGRKITGIFQPHLYSRTRDFAAEFAESLEAVDSLLLLDIYPAREEPIPGITSEVIFNLVKNKNKILTTREELPGIIRSIDTDIVVTLGAGNIDRVVDKLKKILSEKAGNPI